MTQLDQDRLRACIARMEEASADFYKKAIQTGNHAFIEFTGLMNEYITMCKQTVEVGRDFTDTNIHSGDALVARPYNLKYIEEKFDCIFGTTLADATMAPYRQPKEEKPTGPITHTMAKGADVVY